MNKRLLIIESYEYFVSNFYDISYTCSVNDIKGVERFMSLLENHISIHSVGEDFVERYLIFQFDFWSSKDVQFSSKIRVATVFGKKALLRYINRSVDFSWYNAKKNITIRLNRDKNKKELDNPEKWRFHNEKKGLLNCILTTTLFYHRDKACVTCIHKRSCKKILSTRYPELYAKRNYGN